jgi:hypothetical protein
MYEFLLSSFRSRVDFENHLQDLMGSWGNKDLAYAISKDFESLAAKKYLLNLSSKDFVTLCSEYKYTFFYYWDKDAKTEVFETHEEAVKKLKELTEKAKEDQKNYHDAGIDSDADEDAMRAWEAQEEVLETTYHDLTATEIQAVRFHSSPYQSKILVGKDC